MCQLLLVLALPASAADRVDEVRATEIAFAKAFADRDAKKFFSHLADDAQFLGRKKTMRGKQEVIANWSEFFKPAVAPFRWQSDRVVTNAAGDLGFSSGPVFDAAGAQTGTFTVKAGMAQMLKGGVIMDVVTPDQARIAEEAGACAVMALERVPADIRKDGGVARMSDPGMIKAIIASVTIPVMAKARIGHSTNPPNL